MFRCRSYLFPHSHFFLHTSLDALPKELQKPIDRSNANQHHSAVFIFFLILSAGVLEAIFTSPPVTGECCSSAVVE